MFSKIKICLKCGDNFEVFCDFAEKSICPNCKPHLQSEINKKIIACRRKNPPRDSYKHLYHLRGRPFPRSAEPRISERWPRRDYILTDKNWPDDYENKSGIYFIENSSTGLIKIGKTKNLKERLRTLCHAGGIKLKLLAFDPVENVQEYEKTLHVEFDGLRVLGEWFKDHGRIRDYISIVQGRNRPA